MRSKQFLTVWKVASKWGAIEETRLNTSLLEQKEENEPSACKKVLKKNKVSLVCVFLAILLVFQKCLYLWF